jgi:hypothetical protein
MLYIYNIILLRFELVYSLKYSFTTVLSAMTSCRLCLCPIATMRPMRLAILNNVRSLVSIRSAAWLCLPKINGRRQQKRKRSKGISEDKSTYKNM